MKCNAVTVTQLNKYLKDRFDEDENLGAILVKGEISNFKNHYTGHLYFTLKDENSLIKCIMFKSYAERLAFKPKDGMKVMVFGSVSVFERDGVYQIYVKTMMEDGMGDLHEQFEQLKAKLEKEGLFDEVHKKPIPLYPKVRNPSINGVSTVITKNNPNAKIPLPVSMFLSTPMSITFLEPRIHSASMIPNRMKKALPPINTMVSISLDDANPIIVLTLV